VDVTRPVFATAAHRTEEAVRAVISPIAEYLLDMGRTKIELDALDTFATCLYRRPA